MKLLIFQELSTVIDEWRVSESSRMIYFYLLWSIYHIIYFLRAAKAVSSEARKMNNNVDRVFIPALVMKK